MTKTYTVTGYSYDADIHCATCTIKHFGTIYVDGQRDSEGNQPHPIFAGDEFDTDTYCSDCGADIDTCYIGPICDYCGGYHFAAECRLPEDSPLRDCEN